MLIFYTNEREIIEKALDGFGVIPAEDNDALVQQFLKHYMRSRRGHGAQLYAARRNGEFHVFRNRRAKEDREAPIYVYSTPGNFFFTEKAAIIGAVQYLDRLAARR